MATDYAHGRVDLLVLGRIGLDVGGSFVAPASKIIRGMLAALAMADCNELSATALFAQVWHGRPTVARSTTLPVALHRTRQWLVTNAGEAVAIERVPVGYRLVLATGISDVDRFRRYLTPGDTANIGSRIGALEAALSLWRGSPAECLPEAMVDGDVVAKLERERYEARVALARCLLDVGQAERVLDLLEPQVTDTPGNMELRSLITAARSSIGV